MWQVIQAFAWKSRAKLRDLHALLVKSMPHTPPFQKPPSWILNPPAAAVLHQCKQDAFNTVSTLWDHSNSTYATTLCLAPPFRILCSKTVTRRENAGGNNWWQHFHTHSDSMTFYFNLIVTLQILFSQTHTSQNPGPPARSSPICMKKTSLFAHYSTPQLKGMHFNCGVEAHVSHRSTCRWNQKNADKVYSKQIYSF